MTDQSRSYLNKLTWAGVERLLQDAMLQAKPEAFQRIACVSRGGLAIGCLIANLMDIRHVGVLSCEGYVGRDRGLLLKVLCYPEIVVFNSNLTLFVDDIADTGRTMNYIRDIYPRAYRYALVAKPKGLPYVDACSLTVDQDCWVEFPWEIKKGARLADIVVHPEGPQ